MKAVFSEVTPPRGLYDNGHVYLAKTTEGWFRAYRQGQRTWHMVCIVPAKYPNYHNNEGITVKGNKSDTVANFERNYKGVVTWYRLVGESNYRTALMSIVATGKIDTQFEFKMNKDV